LKFFFLLLVVLKRASFKILPGCLYSVDGLIGDPLAPGLGSAKLTLKDLFGQVTL
jgi:hypothetical protein